MWLKFDQYDKTGKFWVQHKLLPFNLIDHKSIQIFKTQCFIFLKL